MNREQPPPPPEIADPKTLPFTLPPIIEEADAAFKRDLPELLRSHENKWVAYHGARRVGIGKTDLELYQRCKAEGLPRGTFIVCRIEPGADDDVIGMFWET